MLNQFPVNPVLPAQDGDRARAFYRDVLGLTLASGPADDPMMFIAGNGTALVVTKIQDRTPPPYPMVSFLVTALEDLVAALKERGATFQPIGPVSFDGQTGHQDGDVLDFGPVRSAFLQDSEGNILALNEIVA